MAARVDDDADGGNIANVMATTLGTPSRAAECGTLIVRRDRSRHHPLAGPAVPRLTRRFPWRRYIASTALLQRSPIPEIISRRLGNATGPEPAPTCAATAIHRLIVPPLM